MNEAEIRMQAQLFALIAEMHACNARVEGMIAENQQCVFVGCALAYTDDSFSIEARNLQKLAQFMRGI